MGQASQLTCIDIWAFKSNLIDYVYLTGLGTTTEGVVIVGLFKSFIS